MLAFFMDYTEVDYQRVRKVSKPTGGARGSTQKRDSNKTESKSEKGMNSSLNISAHLVLSNNSQEAETMRQKRSVAYMDPQH